jgi:DNA-binding CsgD family transcriptional regulator
MNSNNQILHSVWNKSTNIATSKDIYPENIKIDQLLAGIFCPGPHYYYVVDFYDRQIKYISRPVREVLGLDPQKVTFDDIISQIHPEDINYVAQAENMLLNYMYANIRRDKITQYKCSYCFRLKTKDGTYQLFQHQSIVLTTDEKGNFARALNIHTNISHLTCTNNYKATVASLSGDQEYLNIDVLSTDEQKPQSIIFSKREKEVINLIAKGFNSQKIADTLYISAHTVKKHRGNITQKSGVKSSSELIAKCMKEGWL